MSGNATIQTTNHGITITGTTGDVSFGTISTSGSASPVTITSVGNIQVNGSIYTGTTGTSTVSLSAAGNVYTNDISAYGISVIKEAATPGSDSYSVSHSTSLYAIDQEGNLRLTWPYGTTPEDITSDVKHLLTSND